jgi:hypothetical protein
MGFAVRELFLTVRAAWQAADLSRRPEHWWFVVTHQDLIDEAAPRERPIRVIRTSE